MGSSSRTVCYTAKLDISSKYHREERPDGESVLEFVPVDKLRRYFTRDRVVEILKCGCDSCNSDREVVMQPEPTKYVPDIVDSEKPAYSLFGLLVYIQRPVLVIGFLQSNKNDYLLEHSPESFREPKIRSYFERYVKMEKAAFQTFVMEFRCWLPHFAIPHIDSSPFTRYPSGTILPFINVKELGEEENEHGKWTNTGANGKVFSFEIYEGYRKFKHASSTRKFARKEVDSLKDSFKDYLEKANAETVQSYEDPHIVKLIKAYSLGPKINLIFPLAKTNLDIFLRNPGHGYHQFSAHVGDSIAWVQLLGIAKALSKIAGGDPSNARANNKMKALPGPQWVGFHFDLKPANILISDDDTWLITDFGQSRFIFTSETTPRARNAGGTDAYAPPEIEDNDEQIFRRRYDVWSLGCIALEVTAFVVRGYKGNTGPEGLDEVRKSPSPFSRHTDSRFWHRASRTAEPTVKPQISKFIDDLKNDPALSQRSAQFVADILNLVEDMLQPNVDQRKDIWDVIRILDMIINSASSGDDKRSKQTVVRRDELEIGAPHLSSIKIWHWHDGMDTWLESSIRIFENSKGLLRFQSSSRFVPETRSYRISRKKSSILPYYAYWPYETPEANETWLGLSDSDPCDKSQQDPIDDACYRFRTLPDARNVQSLFTYQNIEKSFTLTSVVIRKPPSKSREAFHLITKAFSTKNRRESVMNKIDMGHDLGPATIQLWTQKIDRWADERREGERETETGSSAGKGFQRKAKKQIYQESMRQSYHRRAAIYLYEHKCIILAKLQTNMAAQPKDPSAVWLLPANTRINSPFWISIILPTENQVAAIPLCPEVLMQLENETNEESIECQLQFADKDGAREFYEKYKELKREWNSEQL